MDPDLPERREKIRANIMRNYGAVTGKILEGSNLKGARLRRLKGGYDDMVLLATKGSVRRVIKIFVIGSLPNEVYWYTKAESAGINAPRLISYDSSAKSVPCKYLVMDYIDGKPPSLKSKGLLYRAGLFAGRSLRRLHKTRAGGYGYIEPSGKWSHKTWMETLRYRRRRVISDKTALRVLKPRQIEQIDDLTIYNKSLGFKGARILHGDLYEANMLYSNASDKFSIIDPSSFIIGGDPMYDVSFSTVERGAGFDEGFKRGYRIDELTDKEQHRLKMLDIFNAFYEMTWYGANTDSKWEI